MINLFTHDVFLFVYYTDTVNVTC